MRGETKIGPWMISRECCTPPSISDSTRFAGTTSSRAKSDLSSSGTPQYTSVLCKVGVFRDTVVIDNCSEKARQDITWL